ncbi:uncharacterized protein PV06_04862 [Exophiala oligosperma]|uniref:Uncharacterized protein n=2 Tax=Chaetothyriales TaxID=34395 RepID=A0A0D2C219_9EURO|nr:uncharacterized protein PV06_04862 [Exophiala oligosperma]KIW43797.1 hypothetical protein PV06_04862 [Exophiala oligosperma]
MAHTTDELAVADALLLLSQGPPDFDFGENEETDEETEMRDAARILVSMKDDDPIPTAPTAAASTAPVTWFSVLLQHRPLSTFVQLALTTSTLDEKAELKVQAVLGVMTSRRCVQEAMWYLDANKWDVQDAIKQYQADELQRSAAPCATYGQLNRQAKTVTAENFTSDMLTFTIPGPARSGRKRVVRFPGWETFDDGDTGQLRALNQWRNDASRIYEGPPAVAAHLKRTRYSEHEDRLIRNMFGQKIDHFRSGGRPNHNKMIAFYHQTFQGRYLPGEVKPCQDRQGNFVSSHLQRKFKRKPTDEGGRPLGNYETAVMIQEVRREEQRDYEARRMIDDDDDPDESELSSLDEMDLD